MRRVRELLARVGLRARPAEPPAVDPDDPDLRVVVEAFDETEAASAALARASRWQADSPAVLRHYLALPAREIDRACSMLHEDGWSVRETRHSPQPQVRPDPDVGEPAVTVVALRVQRLDALHCSQESARMAGLAQRLHGRALGWDAAQPEPPS